MLSALLESPPADAADADAASRFGLSILSLALRDRAMRVLDDGCFCSDAAETAAAAAGACSSSSAGGAGEMSSADRMSLHDPSSEESSRCWWRDWCWDLSRLCGGGCGCGGWPRRPPNLDGSGAVSGGVLKLWPPRSLQASAAPGSAAAAAAPHLDETEIWGGGVKE